MKRKLLSLALAVCMGMSLCVFHAGAADAASNLSGVVPSPNFDMNAFSWTLSQPYTGTADSEFDGRVPAYVVPAGTVVTIKGDPTYVKYMEDAEKVGWYMWEAECRAFGSGDDPAVVEEHDASFTLSEPGEYEISLTFLFNDGGYDDWITDSVYFKVEGSADPAPSAPPAAPEFSDIGDVRSWAGDSIDWAVRKKVTVGTSSTTFTPDRTCTVQEILTFLHRAFETDTGDFYNNALAWGIGEGLLAQGDAQDATPCTRAMVVTYLWKHYGSPEAAAGPSFTDVDAGAAYADAVVWAVRSGITYGMTDTTFEPDTVCTRAQIVTFLYRYVNNCYGFGGPDR